VQNYRHHLVHRLVLLPTAGWAVSTRYGTVTAAQVPVVVPEQTPAYVPDTRRARMMVEDVQLGVVDCRSFGSVTYPNGAVEVLANELEFEPAPGYVVVETFTAS